MKESGCWSNGTGKDSLRAGRTSVRTTTQEPKVTRKLQMAEPTVVSARSVREMCYLKVRPLRDLMSHEIIKARRSRVPSARLPAGGYCHL